MKKLSDYPLGDTISCGNSEQASGFRCIPAPDAEQRDRLDAAKDAVIEAAGEPVKRLIKLGGCTGEICSECLDGCQHYPYCKALEALEAITNETTKPE